MKFLILLFLLVLSAFAYQECAPQTHTTRSECLANGCTWTQETCRRKEKPAPESVMCPNASEYPSELRIDCHPEANASPERCAARGCCWNEAVAGIPWCYYAPKGHEYQLVKMHYDMAGTYTGYLKKTGNDGHFGNDIGSLKLEVITNMDNVRIKITDANVDRFEVPHSLVDDYKDKPDYYSPFWIKYTSAPQPFTLTVIRKSDNAVIFDSKKELVFSAQFIEITTAIPLNSQIYGLGQHTGAFALEDDSSDFQVYTIWGRDNPSSLHIPRGGQNMYGSHAYMQIGTPYAGKMRFQSIFLHNANAMDVIIRKHPREVTYRTIGGVLDFFVFNADTPYGLMEQYADLIGKPYMPPRWGAGFQICKWGYENLSQVEGVVDGMKAANMPLDVMWTDIDYMEQNRPLTYDKKNFAGLPNFINGLHKKNMHFMTIFEPAIPSRLGMSYDPYARAIKSDLFVKNHDGSIYEGKVWPGLTNFVDFWHPNATKYWEDGLRKFTKIIDVDGMWLDMNEPANFCDGQCPEGHQPKINPDELVQKDGYPFAASNPPYVPGKASSGWTLRQHTIATDTKQHIGEHYDLHSMYGFSETRITGTVLPKIKGVRPMIVARSSFPGTGRYGSTWLGDNWSKWEYLHMSITGILSNSMFMMPFTGADVCGFNGPSNEEMCVRWMQLGAFQPFYRNHNAKGNPSQEPHVWSDNAQKAMLPAMKTRYTLMSYIYTLMHLSHAEAKPINRALIWEFLDDNEVATIDTQFMLGPALMICPALNEGQTSVDVVFPSKTRWYDYESLKEISLDSNKRTFDAPLNKINVFMRGGQIVTTQNDALKIADQINNPFEIVAALDYNYHAEGELYLDDGIGLNTYENKKYNQMDLVVSTSNDHGLSTRVFVRTYNSDYDVEMKYGTVRLTGIPRCPQRVTVPADKKSGYSCQDKNLFIYLSENMSLTKMEITIDY